MSPSHALLKENESIGSLATFLRLFVLSHNEGAWCKITNNTR